MSSNEIGFFSKSLKLSDINHNSIFEFIEYVKKNRNEIETSLDITEKFEDIAKLIPTVEVIIRFKDAKDAFERAILKDWINENQHRSFL